MLSEVFRLQSRAWCQKCCGANHKTQLCSHGVKREATEKRRLEPHETRYRPCFLHVTYKHHFSMPCRCPTSYRLSRLGHTSVAYSSMNESHSTIIFLKSSRQDPASPLAKTFSTVKQTYPASVGRSGYLSALHVRSFPGVGHSPTVGHTFRQSDFDHVHQEFVDLSFAFTTDLLFWGKGSGRSNGYTKLRWRTHRNARLCE